jgi:hypothetical protein
VRATLLVLANRPLAYHGNADFPTFGVAGRGGFSSHMHYRSNAAT